MKNIILNCLKAVGFIFLFLAVVFLCIALVACDILRDGPFEVSAWSPGAGFHDSGSAAVSLAFTKMPDRQSVEKAFALSADGTAVGGILVWNGRRADFVPSSPLQGNRDYVLALGTGAQDETGLSLEKEFQVSFTTRPPGTRPRFLSSVPPDGGAVADSFGKIKIVFSAQMDAATFSELSLSPAIAGLWLPEDDGFAAEFSPQTAWTAGKSYRLTISENLADINGRTLGKCGSVHFIAGVDTTPPTLVSAWALDEGGARIFQLEAESVSALFDNGGWERTYQLEIEFSEPVDSVSAAASLSTVPSLEPAPASGPGLSPIHRFAFSSEPAFASAFDIVLAPSFKDAAGNMAEEGARFRVIADGPASKPPELLGANIPLAPGDGAEVVFYPVDEPFAVLPIDSGAFPFDTPLAFSIELIFATAECNGLPVSLDVFSVMEQFRFEATNNAFSFSPRAVEETSPGTVKISGLITNKPYLGTVAFVAGAGLADVRGNKSPEDARVLLLK
jgi:hypothetical protein